MSNKIAIFLFLSIVGAMLLSAANRFENKGLTSITNFTNPPTTSAPCEAGYTRIDPNMCLDTDGLGIRVIISSEPTGPSTALTANDTILNNANAKAAILLIPVTMQHSANNRLENCTAALAQGGIGNAYGTVNVRSDTVAPLDLHNDTEVLVNLNSANDFDYYCSNEGPADYCVCNFLLKGYID